MTRHMKIQTVERYERGTNHFLDAILEDETVWLVQGSFGRRPIIAATADLAKQRYAEVLGHLAKHEEDSFADEEESLSQMVPQPAV